MSILLNDPKGVASSGVPGDGQPEHTVAFEGQPDTAVKLPTIPNDYFTRDRPIRLWEVFDDPHFARLFTDEDYFWQFTAQTPFGQHGQDLPHYRDIAMRGAAEAAIAKIWDAPVEEISDTYAAHRIGLSLSLKGYEVRTDAEIFAMLGQAAEESAAWQETNRLMVLESKERENLVQNLQNQAVRSNTSEGVLAGMEGISRGGGHFADDFATENERRSTEDLETEVSLLNKANNITLAVAGAGPQTALAERKSDIARVLKNREMGMDSSVNRGTLRNRAQVAGDYLTAFADATAQTRRNVDEAFPVTEEFRKSLGGKIYGALAGAPSQLAAYSVLPVGVSLTAGQLYNSTYYEALDKGATPKEAHRAGLQALPAIPLEVAADKLVLGKILTGVKGKITLGELQKTLLLTAPAGGASEGLQQLWANFNAKYLSGYDTKRKLDDEIINAILIGTIVDATSATVGQAGAGLLYSDKPPGQFLEITGGVSKSNQSRAQVLAQKEKEKHGSQKSTPDSRLGNPYRDDNGKLLLLRESSLGADPALREYTDKMKAIADRQETADLAYDAIPDSHGGKVIGTDIARELLPEYAADREGKINFVNATGGVGSYYAQDRLWREIQNRGDRKILLFTAGGVAAGKSSVVGKAAMDAADLIFDGTLRDAGWAKKTIQQALHQGWEVRIDYVQRPLELAVAGAVHRANVTGRWGPIAGLPKTHESAQNSILQIAKKFKNNPDVKINFWLNDGEAAGIPAKRIALEQIDKNGDYSYNKIYGIEQRNTRSVGSSSDRESQGSGGEISEGMRRVRQAFRTTVESKRYEPRILRLLAKGDAELERIVEEELKNQSR